MLYTTEETINEIVEITELVKWADAFVLATPDYHVSMSGSLRISWITFGRNLQAKHLATLLLHMRKA